MFRADLQDVGIAFDDLNLPWIHHFGHDRHHKLFAGRLEDLEPIAAEPLEAVGAGSGFERAPTQNIGAGVSHPRRQLEKQGFALDRTGTGDHGEVAATDLDSLDLEDRTLFMKLTAGQLERLENRKNALDSPNRLQRLDLELGLVADDPNNRPRDTLAEVGSQSQSGDPFENMFHHLGSRMRLQHNDHSCSTPFGITEVGGPDFPSVERYSLAFRISCGKDYF